jgi:hypothetical protein
METNPRERVPSTGEPLGMQLNSTILPEARWHCRQ